MNLTKHLQRLSLICLCLIVLGSPALGDTLDPWDPLLIGIAGNNDKTDDVNWLVEQYNLGLLDDDLIDDLVPESLTFLEKYDIGSTSWEGDARYFSISTNSEGSYIWNDGSTSDEKPNTIGSWWIFNDEFDGPVYFSVKAGNEFALYYVGDLTWSSWDTFWTADNVKGKGKGKGKGKNNNYNAISHISFWTAGTTDSPGPIPDPVPEPVTMVLLGMGIIGLAGTGRKYLS